MTCQELLRSEILNLQLKGEKVVELSTSTLSAYCTRLFAAYGADVIRVSFTTEPKQHPSAFQGLGKVRLHTQESLEGIRDALGDATVVINSLDDGQLKRLGVDIDALTADGTICIDLAYSRSGRRPMSSLTAFAASGHLALSGDAGRSPIGVWGYQAEQLVGIAAFGMALAIARHRNTHGSAKRGSIAVSELLSSLEFSVVPWFAYSGVLRSRTPPNSGVGPLSFPVAFYRCADGFVFVNAAGEHHWQMLAIAQGRGDLLEDSRFTTVAGRKQYYEALNAELAPWFANRMREEIIAHLQSHRVPAAPLQSVSEAITSQQLAARSFWHPYSSGDGENVQVPHPAAWFPEIDSIFEIGQSTGEAES